MTTNNTTARFIEIYLPSDDSDDDPIFEGVVNDDEIGATIMTAVNMSTTLHGYPVLRHLEDDRYVAVRVSDNREIAVVYINSL